jgi:hypothetical protein
MQDASAADFQGAIGGFRRPTMARRVLLQALTAFQRCIRPRHGGPIEQARGDKQRAADYWRASIAAMPATSPPTDWRTAAYPDEQQAHTAPPLRVAAAQS